MRLDWENYPQKSVTLFSWRKRDVSFSGERNMDLKKCAH